MNTDAIVMSALKKRRDSLQAQLDGIVMAIAALGGEDGAVDPGKAVARRKRGGWPKGRPRGKKSTGEAPVATADNATAAQAPSTGGTASTDGEVRLTPIQKAQAALKA